MIKTGVGCVVKPAAGRGGVLDVRIPGIVNWDMEYHVSSWEGARASVRGGTLLTKYIWALSIYSINSRSKFLERGWTSASWRKLEKWNPRVPYSEPQLWSLLLNVVPVRSSLSVIVNFLVDTKEAIKLKKEAFWV